MTNEKINIFETYVKELMAKREINGVAVAAVNPKGETLYEQFFGYRDEEEKLPITSDTIYGLASISKSFTSLAIHQMAEKNLLSLQEPVKKHIKEFEYEDITIQHLLSHTAGFFPLSRPLIKEYKDAFDLGDKDPSTYPPFLDKARTFMANRLNTVPEKMHTGEFFSYSNDGFALLSEIVRLYGGHDSFEAYLQHEILGPLGMADTTTLFTVLKDKENITKRYSKDTGEWVGDWDFYNNAIFLPGEGNVKSTLNDMKKYTAFYLSEGKYTPILDTYWLKEMEKPRALSGLQSYYASGLMVNSIGDVTVTGHGGSLPGVATNFAYSKDLGIGFVVLSNYRGFPVAKISDRFFELMTIKDSKELTQDRFTKKKWSQDVLNMAAGTYISGEGMEITVVKNEDTLVILHEGEESIATPRATHSGTCLLKDNETNIGFYNVGTGIAMRVGVRLIPKIKK